MICLILEGGFGKRLYPLTKRKVKSLFIITDKPMISHIVERIQEGIEIFVSIIGDTGFSFEAGNEEDLKEKLKELISHNNLVYNNQMNAQTRIEKYYNWDKITDEMKRIYESLIMEK